MLARLMTVQIAWQIAITLAGEPLAYFVGFRRRSKQVGYKAPGNAASSGPGRPPPTIVSFHCQFSVHGLLLQLELIPAVWAPGDMTYEPSMSCSLLRLMLGPIPFFIQVLLADVEEPGASSGRWTPTARGTHHANQKRPGSIPTSRRWFRYQFSSVA